MAKCRDTSPADGIQAASYMLLVVHDVFLNASLDGDDHGNHSSLEAPNRHFNLEV